jgi:hypothetical protein
VYVRRQPGARLPCTWQGCTTKWWTGLRRRPSRRPSRSDVCCQTEETRRPSRSNACSQMERAGRPSRSEVRGQTATEVTRRTSR